MDRARIVIRWFRIALPAIACGVCAASGNAAFAADTFSCSELGLELRPLAPSEAGNGRLQVAAVHAPGSGPAAGVRRGDVILALDGAPVRSPRKFCGLATDGASAHALLIERRDGRRVVPLIFRQPAVRWRKDKGRRERL